MMKYRMNPCALAAVGCWLAAMAAASGAENGSPPRNVFAERSLVHVLGPSPALVPSDDASAVDSWILESCDVFKDSDTYYWYYHARSRDKDRWPRSYRMCVATAPAPLGPWTKCENNPILDHGPEGSWDHSSVDGAVILKQSAWDVKPNEEKYYLFYSGSAPGGRHIGFATSKSPLGPWRKYEHNPILRNSGYLCGVLKVSGKFYMFTQCPTSSTGVTDQGPFRLATADRIEGPWTKYGSDPSHGVCEGAPVLRPGDWGAWDDGGLSEARVTHHEGVFHCFYGGTKSPKIESIGYAYSFDGVHWHKYGANPVVSLRRVPDCSGRAEGHAHMEGPYVYLYHTLRYFTGKGSARGIPSLAAQGGWGTEDLGVQVLTIDPRFKIAMPLLSADSLDPKASTRIEQCAPIGMESASTLALSVACTYDAAAQAGLRLHVRGSDDGVHYDTVDLYTFDVPADAGKSARKTVELSPKVRYVRAIVENLDGLHSAKSLSVTATVGN